MSNDIYTLEDGMLQSTGLSRNQAASEAPATQGLKSLIQKLRWAGLDEDAEELCHQLENIAPHACVPPGPRETD
jgi:hypothetical protein